MPETEKLVINTGHLLALIAGIGDLSLLELLYKRVLVPFSPSYSKHQDRSITGINFLRYSEKEWGKIAGNEFAYCNRLRVSDYLWLFEESGFDVCRKEVQEDKGARRSLENGFMIDEKFRDYSVDDLCATGLRVALTENRKAVGI